MTEPRHTVQSRTQAVYGPRSDGQHQSNPAPRRVITSSRIGGDPKAGENLTVPLVSPEAADILAGVLPEGVTASDLLAALDQARTAEAAEKIRTEQATRDRAAAVRIATADLRAAQLQQHEASQAIERARAALGRAQADERAATEAYRLAQDALDSVQQG